MVVTQSCQVHNQRDQSKPSSRLLPSVTESSSTGSVTVLEISLRCTACFVQTSLSPSLDDWTGLLLVSCGSICRNGMLHSLPHILFWFPTACSIYLQLLPWKSRLIWSLSTSLPSMTSSALGHEAPALTAFFLLLGSSEATGPRIFSPLPLMLSSVHCMTRNILPFTEVPSSPLEVTTCPSNFNLF